MKIFADRSLLIRSLTMATVLVVLSWITIKHLHVEQDVVSAIEKSRPDEAAIFNQLQGSGLFQNRVFIRLNEGESNLQTEVVKKLEEAGYLITPAFETNLRSPRELYAFLPFLPDSALTQLLSAEHEKEILEKLQSILSAPGGLSMVHLLEEDPLLLSQTLPKLIRPGETSTVKAPLVAKRSGDIDWEKTRTLYTYLKSRDQQLSFMSGDFFALENYDAVRHDITLCSILSLVLSLIVFRLFCRQWSLLVLLIIGTAASSILGLLLAESMYAKLYGLVLAFTSTFVSFNNETLVHLAGLDFKKENRASLIGTFSAIGTTIIGFLVMLFSSSHLTRQLAVISLGSLVGFILFLLVFVDSLKKMRFRSLQLFQWVWNKKLLTVLFFGSIALIIILPKPTYKTNLEEFRYASLYLESQVARFSKNYASFSFESLNAIPLSPNEDPYSRFQILSDSHELSPGQFHPLTWYLASDTQSKRILNLSQTFKTRFTSLEAGFRTAGVNIRLDSDIDHWASRISSREYLNLWQKVWPLPWYVSTAKQSYMLAFLDPSVPVVGAIPLHPKTFYELILNELTQNLGTLFLIGLFLMLLYLVPWQRSGSKIALIFLPLLLSTLGLQIFFYFTHRHLTIVHVMGLSLVIAVALDYATILVSTDHAPKDQGKVVLTGGLTLCSFGSMLFAEHPVLRELALVVVIGSSVALAMALFTRMPRAEDKL